MAVITIPCMFWAARLSNPNTVVHSLVRAILDVVRAIPDLLCASVLIAMVVSGRFPARARTHGNQCGDLGQWGVSGRGECRQWADRSRSLGWGDSWQVLRWGV